MAYGGFRARPDGPVRYRYDAATGRRVGVIPASCKLGLHKLAETGYHAREEDGMLWVSCVVCAETPVADFAWKLAATAPSPDTAELDDGPYAGIDPVFIDPMPTEPPRPSP